MVTTIIITHNRKALLERAIKSVLSQTYKNLELIVVSDGSTDGTDSFMENYNDDDRVQYISYYPGRGANYARNTGIQAASGELVAFLDDDDEWLPSKIEEQVNTFNSDERIGIVYTGTNVIYEDAGIKYKSVVNKSGDLSKDILFENHIGSTTTVMAKKLLLEQAGMFDEKLPANQDYDLWIRICQLALVGVVAKPLVNYYNCLNSNQISSNTQKYINAYKYIDSKYSGLFAKLTKKEIKLKEAIRAIDLGLRNLRNGDRKTALNFLIKSMKIQFRISTVFYVLLSILDYKYLLKLRRYKSLFS